jgi:hypothetical protein
MPPEPSAAAPAPPAADSARQAPAAAPARPAEPPPLQADGSIEVRLSPESQPRDRAEMNGAERRDEASAHEITAADPQPARRAFSADLPASVRAAEAPVSSVFRAQRLSGENGTSWTAAQGLPQPAAAAELKALVALLAPRQTGNLQEAEFAAQIAGRIQNQLRNGEEVVRIQLKPGALGRLEITAETTSAGVLATMTAESTAVKNFLEQNLHLLHQAFQDQGLKVDHISVGVQEAFSQQNPSSGHERSGAGHQSQGNAASAGWKSGQPETGGDEISLDPQILAARLPHSTFHTVA